MYGKKYGKVSRMFALTALSHIGYATSILRDVLNKISLLSVYGFSN